MLALNAAGLSQSALGKTPIKSAIAIKDSGVDIKPSEMEHIFRPSYATKPEIKGTGLGLSVSHGIVKNHHGEAESQLGEGATSAAAD